MSIHVSCEECFYDYSVKDQLAGKRIKCKECGAAIRIPTHQESEDDAGYMSELLAEEERDRQRRKKKSQKDLPSPRMERSKRKPMGRSHASTGIAGGALTLVLIAVVFAAKTGLLQNLIPSNVNWVSYTTQDGNLTVSVTGKVKEKKMPVAEGVVNQRMDISEHRLFGCAVTMAEFDQELTHPITRRPLSLFDIKLILIPEMMRAKPGSRQLGTMEETSFSGVPALIVKMEVPLPGGEKAVVDSAIFSVGKYLYSVEFITPKDKPQDKYKKQFFDSVKLSDSLVQRYHELNGGVAPAGLAQNNPIPKNSPEESMPATPGVIPNIAQVNPNIKKSVREAPAKVSWTVKPDPLPTQPDWVMAKKIVIDLPGLSDAVYLPDPYGETVVIGAGAVTMKEISLFSLATGKRIQKFTGTPQFASKFCFSPDAKLLAAYRIKSSEIEIWDLNSSEMTHKLIFDKSLGALRHMDFTDPTHLLIMQWQKPDIKMSEYNLYDLSQKSDSLKPSKTFVDKSMYFNDDFIRSPGNRYIAGASYDRKDVYVLDWKQGKFVGEIDVPDSSGRGNAFYIKGLGFSPDGEIISVLSETSDETVVFGFSIETGKLVWEHHLGDQISNLIPGANPDTVGKAGYAMNWLADSSAYSIMGRMLIDAKTGKVLWFLESILDEKNKILANNRSFYLTNQGMLSIESDGYNRQLQLIEFSPGEIRKSLALIDQPDQAKIGPGSTVSLDIEIAQVEHVEKEQAIKEITELLTQKLEEEGFKVAGEADYVLHFDYRELAGEPWRPRDSKGNFPSTKMQYRIQWLAKGDSKELWEAEYQFIPVIVLISPGEGEVTATKIRNKIFEKFSDHLMGRPIVTFIPKDETLPMLPQFDKTHY